MAEVVTYEGQAGLMAVAHALNDVRRKLQAAEIGVEHAAGILGCMNMHLARLSAPMMRLSRSWKSVPA